MRSGGNGNRAPVNPSSFCNPSDFKQMCEQLTFRGERPMFAGCKLLPSRYVLESDVLKATKACATQNFTRYNHRPKTGTKQLSAEADTMHNAEKRHSDCYSETEAANLLGISVSRLHMLLDENIFNDGSKRPPDLYLRASDLVLLEFWNRSTENPNVLRMPRRDS
jgi:hypothetical protein